MTPWDLIVWALAIGAGLLSIALPVALVIGLINEGRGKL